MGGHAQLADSEPEQDGNCCFVGGGFSAYGDRDPSRHCVADMLDKSEYARVEGVGKGCHCSVSALCGEGLLGQVVRSDADKVEVGQERRDLQRGGRHFDHHAQTCSIGQAPGAATSSSTLRASRSSPMVATIGNITLVGICLWPVDATTRDAVREAARAISRELGAMTWPPTRA
jgi:hypothetical protein